MMSAFYLISFYFSFLLHICLSSVCCHLMRTVIFYLYICMLVQSVSVFSLAVFLWALLPEIKWMMMMMMMIKFLLNCYTVAAPQTSVPPMPLHPPSSRIRIVLLDTREGYETSHNRDCEYRRADCKPSWPSNYFRSLLYDESLGVGLDPLPHWLPITSSFTFWWRQISVDFELETKRTWKQSVLGIHRVRVT